MSHQQNSYRLADDIVNRSHPETVVAIFESVLKIRR
ncbi:unnamed protein product [Tenebrio molitor]|nr:unnamed protein product [Tenebrio molitor]